MAEVPFIEVRDVLRETVERTVQDLVNLRDLPREGGEKGDGVNVPLDAEGVTHSFGTSKYGLMVTINVKVVG